MSQNTIQSTVNCLFRDKTNNAWIQFFRYGFVGGFAFLVDFSCLFVLTHFFGVHYLLSAAIAFVLGVITNYSLSILWVFQSRAFENRWAEVVLFTAIGIVGLGLNEVFIWYFTEHVHFHYLLSKIVSTILVYCWNFFARKLILFR